MKHNHGVKGTRNIVGGSLKGPWRAPQHVRLMKILILLTFLLAVEISAVFANSDIDKNLKHFRYNKVQCSFQKALEITEKAALNKFPEYKDAILDDKNPGFSERHGGGEPETIIREYILKYKVIDKYKSQFDQYTIQTEKGILYYHESYYKDSIQVILNNACEIIDVRHKKGTSYIVE